MCDDILGRLQAYYARAFPTKYEPEIRNLVNTTSGWVHRVYSFDVEYGPAGGCQYEKLILRICPAAVARAALVHEFHSLRQLHAVGYPVPRAWVLETDDTLFEQPFIIMERIEGQNLWSLLFDSPEERQQELLSLFCDLFVRLHKLDWRPFVEDTTHYEAGGAYVFVDQWLRGAHDFLEESDKPGFLPIVNWLEERRDDVPCPQLSVVHLDYHPDNVLLRPDGSAVVVDWTSLDVGDPRLDLSKALCMMDFYQGAAWRTRTLQEYERQAGHKIEQIEWFDVATYTGRLFQAAALLSGEREKMGLLPAAATETEQQMGAVRRIYNHLLGITGVRIAEIEQLLTSFS
jgi:aminoglycoside phosphotransferase (APT) family kinase protein